MSRWRSRRRRRPAIRVPLRRIPLSVRGHPPAVTLRPIAHAHSPSRRRSTLLVSNEHNGCKDSEQLLSCPRDTMVSRWLIGRKSRRSSLSEEVRSEEVRSPPPRGQPGRRAHLEGPGADLDERRGPHRRRPRPGPGIGAGDLGRQHRPDDRADPRGGSNKVVAVDLLGPSTLGGSPLR